MRGRPLVLWEPFVTETLRRMLGSSGFLVPGTRLDAVSTQCGTADRVFFFQSCAASLGLIEALR